MKDNAFKKSGNTDARRLLVFVLESKNFGIELSKIKEITDILPITRLPGARDFVKGLSNLRGEVIPIISLRERLKMSGNEIGKQLVIVIGKKINYGLLIDRIDGIYETKGEVSKAISSILAGDVETSFLRGVVRVDGRDAIILDCEKLVEKNE